MSLVLAPYNNAMRLGQGFNTFTQQICIDDAVVVDPERAENVLTNDGTTMRIVAENSSKPSLWNRQKEVVTDDRAALEVLHEEERAAHSSRPQPAEAVAYDGHAASDIEVVAAQGDSDSASIEKIEAEVEPKCISQQPGEEPEVEPTDANTAKPGQTNAMVSPTGPMTRKERANEAALRRQEEERQRRENERRHREELEKEKREEARRLREEDRQERAVKRQEERQYQTARRQANREAIQKAVDAKASSLTMDELQKIAAQNQFADRFSGMVDDDDKFTFDATGARGLSQTVVYSSRFIDKLSDVTDDMCVSAALSIKSAKVGGSGRGSFVDSDKFKSSDLNFYISVKVINQTVNFKDALLYNPLKNSSDMSNEDFRDTYGDSFISGFVEGGEFNAIVSMKVLNKAKLTDIKAEAQVALTAGPVDVAAQGNLGIARSNLETNTETTIQVSWCGGGQIKPMEQQWTIKSLMQAAARFPDLVAECPQRTHCILSKYETLRSFLARKPAKYSAMAYENAQLYTGMLMDTFMSYKALYKTVGEHIFNIQKGFLEFEPVTGSGPDDSTTEKFPRSLTGMSDARRKIRNQMSIIVNEVDFVGNFPKEACEPSRQEPFISPVAFEESLPKTRIPEKYRPKSDPLTGRRMMPKTQTETEFNEADKQAQAIREASPLVPEDASLSTQEKSEFATIEANFPGIGNIFNVSTPVGASYDEKCESFNYLEVLQPNWPIKHIAVEIDQGAVASVQVLYRNGVLVKNGEAKPEARMRKIANFAVSERVTSAVIEYGTTSDTASEERILSLRLFTNQGRSLLGQAYTTQVSPDGSVRKDGASYTGVKTTYLDCTKSNSTFGGFYGQVSPNGSMVRRLGVIWATTDKAALSTTSEIPASTIEMQAATGAAADFARLQESLDNAQSRLDKAEKALADTKAILDTKTQQLTDSEASITSLNADFVNTQKKLNDLQSGTKVISKARADLWKLEWSPNDVSSSRSPNLRTVDFTPPFSKEPRVISGISEFDVAGREGMDISMQHNKITTKGVDLTARSANTSATAYMSWLSLPENDIRIEHGTFDTSGIERTDNNMKASTRIMFSKPFDRTPQVVVWFQKLELQGNQWRSLKIDTDRISTKWFDLSVRTWANRTFESAVVGWMAIDDTNSTNGRVKTGVIEVNRAQKNIEPRISCEGWSRPPSAVFVAVREIDFNDNESIRLTGRPTKIENGGFNVKCGTWHTSDMDHSKFTYVAFE